MKAFIYSPRLCEVKDIKNGDIFEIIYENGEEVVMDGLHRAIHDAIADLNAPNAYSVDAKYLIEEL